MTKNIIILVGSSFIFDILFGMILMSKTNFFVVVKKRVPDTGIRHVYKLIFFIVLIMIVVVLKKAINLNDMIAAIILGISISLAGIIFSKSKTPMA